MFPQNMLRFKPPVPVNVSSSGPRVCEDDQGKGEAFGWP